jgi:hypothetical protein
MIGINCKVHKRRSECAHGNNTHTQKKRGARLRSPGCRGPIGGISVASRAGERRSGSMGDVDLDFGRGVGVGARATASPRSTDTSKSPSDTARLVSSRETLGISVSSHSRCNDGGGGSGIKLCVASVGWKNRKIVVVSSITCACGGDWLLATYIELIEETQGFGV